MRRTATLVLTLLVAAGWLVFLRPTSLGGPADYIVVSGTSMLPTFKPGDLVVVRRARSYHRGDVVTYRVPHAQPGAGARVIHRIVGGSPSTGFVTKGDNNGYTDLWRPKRSDVVGRRWVAVPGFGRVLVGLRRPIVVASVAAAVAFASVLLWQPRQRAAAPQPTVSVPFM